MAVTHNTKSYRTNFRSSCLSTAPSRTINDDPVRQKRSHKRYFVSPKAIKTLLVLFCLLLVVRMIGFSLLTSANVQNRRLQQKIDLAKIEQSRLKIDEQQVCTSENINNIIATYGMEPAETTICLIPSENNAQTVAKK